MVPLLPPSLVSPSSNRGSADFDCRHVLHATAFLPRAWTSGAGVAAPDCIRLANRCRGDVSLGRAGDGHRVTGAFFWSLCLCGPTLIEDVPLWIPRQPRVRRAEILNRRGILPRGPRVRGRSDATPLSGAPLRQMDLSVSRFVRVGERRLTLRLDAFNLLNIPNVRPTSLLFFFQNQNLRASDSSPTRMRWHGDADWRRADAHPTSRRSPLDSIESALCVLTASRRPRCTSCFHSFAPRPFPDSLRRSTGPPQPTPHHSLCCNYTSPRWSSSAAGAAGDARLPP